MQHRRRFPLKTGKKLAKKTDSVDNSDRNPKNTVKTSTGLDCKEKKTKDGKGKRETKLKKKKWEKNETLPNMGDFQEKVVILLEKSKKPMSPAIIGKKLGRTKEFVFIWLSSIGKHLKAIKKVSPGKYIFNNK